jgi:hypothetical protein
MANYAVDSFLSDPLSPEDAVAAVETYLETVDNAKTIRLIQVVQIGSALFQGVVIHDT